MLTKTMIGVEQSLEEVARRLRKDIQSERAPVIGAHQIACSDESEKENVKTFHRMIVRELLPELKFWSRSSFRTANLGGRYEPGSIAICEDHYAIPASEDDFKLLAIKLNSHVSVERKGDELVYGKMDRYERESVYCGALHALLEGHEGNLPFLRELEETFASGGLDRLATLRDEGQIRHTQRELIAAIVNARLQAARVVSDIEAHTPRTPTLYILLSCVTLNRARRDHELIVGIHTYDTRPEQPVLDYAGLGDDPRRYRISHEGGILTVTDQAASN